ncbi:MAG: GAF domain-containing protein, partial [Proteobacteria bacterium]|nr:GAF domain-containing protein [Pseudomonadota bacterium]
MSTVLNARTDGANVADERLNFLQKLHVVTNKVHSTGNIDQIMLELPRDICELFNCDRITIYAVSDDKRLIVSKVKSGLTTFSNIELPISGQSMAGYAAMHKRIVRINDVYDDTELNSHNPPLHFLKEVDRRTGYRTKQMLLAPLLDPNNGELLGVLQLINNRSGGPFTEVAEEGVKELCSTLVIALNQRMKPTPMVRSKYDALVADAVMSAQEFDLATRSARRKNVDIEEILISEFQVQLPTIGQALSKFFGEPYEPFKADRIKPVDLLKNIKRDYIEQNHWLPLDDTKEGIVILSSDPERVKGARLLGSIFPRAKFVYRVTTHKEFLQTLDAFYGAANSEDSTSVGDLLSGMDDGEDENSDNPD